jgi:hypothetical protein
MAYNETGHAMNAAAFNKMNLEVAGLGDIYNPSNAQITLQALRGTNDLIKEAMSDVKNTESKLGNLIKARQKDFEPISPLVTRILGVVDSSDMLSTKKTALRTLGKKITGANTKKKKKDPADANTVNYSTSRMSYIMRLDNLEMLVIELEQSPEYAPNEKDMQVASLRQLINRLKAQKEDINNAIAALSKARNRRDTLLYAMETGAAELLKKVKSYVKSWPEGTKGNDFKRINKIVIRK